MGDTVISLSRKHCEKRRNCSLRAISPFPTMFSKAVGCSSVKMSTLYLRSEGLRYSAHFTVFLWTL